MTEKLYSHERCDQPGCVACVWQDRFTEAMAGDPLLRCLRVSDGPYLLRDAPGWVLRLEWDDGPPAATVLSRLEA